MSNFSKSIFYSGLVLAVGLMAVFALYDTMTEENPNSASSLSAIQPAAGTPDSEATFKESLDEAVQNAVQLANEVNEDSQEALEDLSNDAQSAYEDFQDDAENEVEETSSEAEEAADDALETVEPETTGSEE